MSRLDALSIALPCTASWEAMAGDDARRFCGACGKHVYNLEALTCDEATDLLARPEGPPCVRFSRLADGRVRTRDRWAALVAAVALSACQPFATTGEPPAVIPEVTVPTSVPTAVPDAVPTAIPEVAPSVIPEASTSKPRRPHVNHPVVTPEPARPPEVAPPLMGAPPAMDDAPTMGKIAVMHE